MSAGSGAAALENADRYSSYEQGMCLQYVRGPCWEIGSFYGSAIDAWNGAKYKHPGDRNPPKGAPCYYRGGTYGHVVIARGGSARKIRSTDCTTATQVSNADLSWPETAWGDDYLGWSEDLNGVRLPNLGEEDDMELDDTIAEWSPDDGDGGDTTVGKTLNQARGYSEDAYQRVKKLENQVDDLGKKIDKILNAVT